MVSFDEFRIGDGGALRGLEARWHLTNLAWQVTCVLLLTWVPIMVFGVLSPSREPLLHDPGMYVRLLLGAPILLYLDFEFPTVCSRCLGQLLSQGFVPEVARPQLQRTLRSATRLADSRLPEVVIIVLSVAVMIGALWHRIPLTAHGLTHGLSVARLWYAVLALPLFEFLLLRSLWRWVVWVRFLVGVSHIELALDPTHPDCRGGIGFLRYPSIAYCEVLLFVVSSVFVAESHGRAMFGSTIGSFVPLLVLFAAVGMLVAFGPLLVFAPQLVRARRFGRIEVGGFTAKLGRRFRRRWIVHTESAREADPSSDVQELAAAAATYRDRVDRLYWLLFEKHDLITLVLATASPLVGVMLARVPSDDWLQLLGMVGGSIVPSP